MSEIEDPWSYDDLAELITLPAFAGVAPDLVMVEDTRWAAYLAIRDVAGNLLPFDGVTETLLYAKESVDSIAYALEVDLQEFQNDRMLLSRGFRAMVDSDLIPSAGTYLYQLAFKRGGWYRYPKTPGRLVVRQKL